MSAEGRQASMALPTRCPPGSIGEASKALAPDSTGVEFFAQTPARHSVLPTKREAATPLRVAAPARSPRGLDRASAAAQRLRSNLLDPFAAARVRAEEDLASRAVE